MRSRDSVLFAFVALVVGVGAGFLFATALQGPRPALASGPRAAEPAPSRPPAPAVRGTRPDVSLRPVERTAAVPSTEAPEVRMSETQLERVLERTDEPTVATARGEGVIAGEVLDAAGMPIQGVVVIGFRLDSNRASDPAAVGVGAPADESLEDFLRERAKSWAESRAGRRRAVTGAGGGFELTGLLESASYRLEAYLDDHVLESDESSYQVTPGQSVTFRAQAVHVIPVRLVHEGGAPPREGVVAVERGGRDTYYAWSPDAPSLRLTAGRVGVRGYSGLETWGRGRGNVVSTHGSQEASVDVVDQAGVPLELVLKARSGIDGRVVDDFGTTGGRPMVRLLALAASGELDEKALAESDRIAWLTGNRFHFMDLTPGSYGVGLSNRSEAMLVSEVVRVDEGILELELVVPAPDPERSLIVRAFGPSGNPLQDLEFRWQFRQGGSSRSGGIQGRRAPDGAYWLRPKAEFFEPWGAETSYTLTVQHSELGDREIELERGQREVTVTFQEPVAILVTVVGYAGSGYEGRLQVDVEPVVEGEEDPSSRRMRSFRRGRGEEQFSPEGSARFDGLAPGAWTVRLQVKTGEWELRTLETVEVRVTHGEQVVSMSLPTLYELVVVAPGLSSTGRLFLSRTDGKGDDSGFGFDATAEIGEGGRAVFRDLLAGEYSLRGSGVRRPVAVTVPSGDVYLDDKEPDCLRVAIGDMEGGLYEAGLRAGDLIIGVDGEEFTSAPNWWQLFQGEGELSLMVLRDGERLELAMERIPAGSDWVTSLGGMLTPTTRP